MNTNLHLNSKIKNREYFTKNNKEFNYYVLSNFAILEYNGNNIYDRYFDDSKFINIPIGLFETLEEAQLFVEEMKNKSSMEFNDLLDNLEINVNNDNKIKFIELNQVINDFYCKPFNKKFNNILEIKTNFRKKNFEHEINYKYYLDYYDYKSLLFYCYYNKEGIYLKFNNGELMIYDNNIYDINQALKNYFNSDDFKNKLKNIK